MKWLLLPVLALAAVQAYAAGGCFASCREDKKNCTFSRTVSREGEGSIEPLLPQKSRKLDDCMTLKSDGGSLGLMFRVGGKQNSASIDDGQPFKQRLAVHKALDCLPIDKKCDSSSPQVPVQMGKAFDPAAAPTEIAGQPCALALPCGKVGLASDGSLAIRLTEAATDGSLTLFATRGDTAPQRVDVKAGSAVVPTGALKPGQTYRYRLIKADGSMRSAGEFQVLSQKAQADSDAALRDALKGPKGEEGALESLLLDGRDWEAFQRTVGSAK